MSTTQLSPRRSRLQRFADWTLDHDGTMYGDERERLRWYEAIAVTASVQAFLVAWTLAILVWVGGRPVAPYLLAVFAAFVLPTLISSTYVQRRQVQAPERPDRKFVLVAVALNLPYLVFVLGAARAYLEGRAFTGSVVGAVVGGLGAWAIFRGAAWLLSRRRRSAPDPS